MAGQRTPSQIADSPATDLEKIEGRLQTIANKLGDQREALDSLADEASLLRQQLRKSSPLTEQEARLANLQQSVKELEEQTTSLADNLNRAEGRQYEHLLRSGNVLRESQNYHLAIVEFCRAIALAPQNYDAFVNRGLVYQDLGEWQRALDDFETAARRSPDNVTPWNNLAWLKATCPDEQFRNGAEAVEDATKTCELSKWENFAALSTLAAAYAEQADFEKAIEWQQKSIELAPEQIRPVLDEGLRLYEAHMPMRIAAKLGN